MRKTIFSLLVFTTLLCFTGCSRSSESNKKNDGEETITLRVCNWEEYIDTGDWDEEETISLENKDIIGKNSLITDFENWYKKKYGKTVKVEYSTFGTNEELYNQLTLGDRFDLVCPSEYMIMKLMAEDKLEPLSDSFLDSSKEDNYYVRGVAPYIKELTKSIQVNNTSIDRYVAGYMWGTTGMVYNPDEVTEKEASTFKLLTNDKFKHRITIKDNVRDAYFAALGILKSDELISLYDDTFSSGQPTKEELLNYQQTLKEEMNDVSVKSIKEAETLLQKHRTNFYSFETDSGKSDMITGKVVANYQWSGDAVYSLDQAEEDDFYLCYAVPEESSNLWFDGFVMLKDGIEGNADKKQAAEAFMNYLSLPENAVRNMYFIGYTSVITGPPQDNTVFDYANYCYAAEDTDTDTASYDLTYFFKREQDDKNYVITTTKDQLNRQLFAQYPPKEVLNRCAVMDYFGNEKNKELNQMWIHVRCFNPFR